MSDITIGVDGPGRFGLYSYNETDGTAWFDDVQLQLQDAAPAPPVITGVTASGIGTTQATIAWLTDQPADGQVEYGKTTAYGLLTALDVRLLTTHNSTLLGLSPGTLYHYRVRSKNSGAALAVTGDFALATSPVSDISGLKTGGLVSFPVFSSSPYLLGNPGLENLNPTTGKPLSWSENGLSVDSSVAHSGLRSIRLKDPHLLPYTQSAWQDLPVRKGVYCVGGWIKMAGVAATRGNGVRICLGSSAGGGCTGIVKGTSDWQYIEQSDIFISGDTSARVSLGGYNEPDGTAWFDDIQLRMRVIPLEVFLLYPNYRGVLFDDQSQVARFAITVNPPVGGVVSEYQLNGAVTDETTGVVVLQNSLPASASTTATFDFSRLVSNRTYLVSFRSVKIAGAAAEYTYPAYRITKVPSSIRQSMTVAFDEQNRFLLHGKPSFILGVYDSGIGYASSEAGWESTFTAERRLFELPINFYLNYWYGAAPNSSIIPMMNVLQRRGIYTLTNANCCLESTVEQVGPSWFIQSPDTEVQTRAAHPGFGGFYAADECSARIAADVFTRYQRMKLLDPDGVVLGTQLANKDLVSWRDAVDVLATDPYPLYGTEPAGGFPLSTVADWTRDTREAVQNSRPFATTLQFFQTTLSSRWPTKSELRNMSYMAIAEGANGLFYWSLGVKALAWVCTGWCPAKIEYFERLKAVLNELKSIEAALAASDRPELLLSNSNTAAIHTRMKSVDGQRYLIASNVTRSPAFATLVCGSATSSVSVYNESRTLPVSAGAFTDTFGPYEAHVYVIR